MAMPAQDLSLLPPITPTASGRMRVLPRPVSWDAIAILEDANGEAVGLAASRRKGAVLELSIRPLTNRNGRLDARALSQAISRHLVDVSNAWPAPVRIVGQTFATGTELGRCTPTPGGIRGLAWRLSMQALAEVNQP